MKIDAFAVILRKFLLKISEFIKLQLLCSEIILGSIRHYSDPPLLPSTFSPSNGRSP